MTDIQSFRDAWFLHPSPELPRPRPESQNVRAKTGCEASLAETPFADASPFDIIGQYRAWVVLSYVDVSVAQACLEPGLELDPPPGTPAGKHPILYSFGRHYGVHPRFFTLWSYDYDEAIMGLCNVKFKHANDHYSGPYFRFACVRLDDTLADDIGTALGLPKKIADFQTTPDTYFFRMPNDHDHEPLFQSHFVLDGDAFTANLPNFQTIEPFMNQPVISRSSLGEWIVTDFFMDFRNAAMTPMRSEIAVRDNSLAGLPGGRYTFATLRDTAINGMYRSVHCWRMSPPRRLPS